MASQQEPRCPPSCLGDKRPFRLSVRGKHSHNLQILSHLMALARGPKHHMIIRQYFTSLSNPTQFSKRETWNLLTLKSIYLS